MEEDVEGVQRKFQSVVDPPQIVCSFIFIADVEVELDVFHRLVRTCEVHRLVLLQIKDRLDHQVPGSRQHHARRRQISEGHGFLGEVVEEVEGQAAEARQAAGAEAHDRNFNKNMIMIHYVETLH